MPCYGQRRMVRLLQAEKKARVSQITTCAKKCILFCISFKYKKNLEKYWKQTHVIIKLEGNRGCNLHRITKIGQQNIRKVAGETSES